MSKHRGVVAWRASLNEGLFTVDQPSVWGGTEVVRLTDGQHDWSRRPLSHRVPCFT
jgi:hypothetical protein